MASMREASGTGTERYATLDRYVRRATWTLALLIVGVVITLLIARAIRVRSSVDEMRGRTVVRLTLATELAATNYEAASRLAVVLADSAARAPAAGPRAPVAPRGRSPRG